MADDIETQPRPIVSRVQARGLGLLRYFTGVPCCRGHRSERRAYDGHCLACMDETRSDRLASQAKWYLVNRQRLLKKQTDYRDARPGLAAKNYAKDPDGAKKRAAAWRVANPERLKAQQDAGNARRAPIAAKRYIDNREALLAQNAIWKAANPESRRLHGQTRRARKFGALEKYTVEDIVWLMDKQGSKCAHSWCRKNLKSGKHVDHIIPLKLNGSNGRKNLQLLCAPCNLKKNAKHPIDFARQNGMLL